MITRDSDDNILKRLSKEELLDQMVNLLEYLPDSQGIQV